MQQFVIPQFIDNEDRILGPIVVRQFLILLVVAFFTFLAYRFADFSLFIVLTIVLWLMGGVLAFARPNGRPFHFFLLNFLQSFMRADLRVWKKEILAEELSGDTTTIAAPVGASVVRRAPPSTSRLSELALVVDTGGAFHGDNEI